MASRENYRGGSTALVLLTVGNRLFAAHAGDSRAVMCVRGEAVRVTEDHKPNLPSEHSRVLAAGGRVEMQGCWRVMVDPGGGRPGGALAVSRCGACQYLLADFLSLCYIFIAVMCKYV